MPLPFLFRFSRFLKQGLQLLTLAVAAASLMSVPMTADASTKSKTPAKKKVVIKKQAAGKGTNKVAVRKATAQKNGRTQAIAKAPVRAKGVVRVSAPPRLSYAQMAGLHRTADDLDLKSSVALVIDQDTQEVLLSKNDHAVLPIASLTKLMTGLLISEAHLPMDEMITISQDDVDTEKWSGSRLRVGTTLSRGELLHLALMSSENRAAHALGRTYPGGLGVFVNAMNARARGLGMMGTHYVEPTGLSSRNQSSAQDLAILVGVAAQDPVLRDFSTSPGYEVAVGNRTLQYNNTNRLVKNPSWDIALQKTGYISEAGQCLVMQARIAGRRLVMVFLDSAGKLSRLGDAERVRKWVESNSDSLLPGGATPIPVAAQRISG